MTPKPFSIRHRFVLLQVTSFSAVICLVIAAIYCSEQLRREITQPLADLRVAVTLHAEIEAAEDRLMMSAAMAQLHPGEASEKFFDSEARRLPALSARYLKLPLPDDERRSVETIRELQDRLVETAHSFPREGADPAERAVRLGQLGAIHHQVELSLQEIAQLHLGRLGASEQRQRTYSSLLSVSLVGLALCSVLALTLFRRSHRRDIWGPLEELRRMVAEIRGGNLSPAGKMPNSVELGALVRAFLDMAEELRVMRDSLEEKVRARSAELEATQKELIQAAKLSSLGEVISGVAHEINNPLTAILGFSELALDRPRLEPALRAQLERMHDEALRLKSLVANLSSFARPGFERRAPLDLRHVLERVADLRRYQLTASNIRLHLDRPAQPVWVNGDRDQLVQVLFNLALNAEQAILSSGDRGDIWMACEGDNGRALATVRDNGPGIPPGVMAHIFDPFFTTRPVGKGTGLGLSISHSIVQQHGGTITAESVDGQGALIHIALPAGDPPVEPPPSPALPSKQSESPAGPRRHLLVIDDETNITLLVQALLKGRGWTCTSLNDPTALEAVLNRGSFDAVLCDLKMPGRNGLEVLRVIQSLRPQLAHRFLLMTGNLADAGEKEPAELAGVPIVRKPFTTAGLVEAILALLPQPQ